MPRAIWKGAVTFGLVHVPVALYPASQETEIDFDWLDRRTLDPVGYRRVNKRTGREVASDDIVKGVKQGDGRYVVLGEDEIRQAYPRTTQTIDIQAFVPAHEISFVHVERPYYLEPLGRAGKVYALLREALADAGLLGIARVVLHAKEHLAALLPAGPALMLGTLRWADEIRGADGLNLPPAGRAANHLKDEELRMARQLIAQMTTPWRPQDYADTFSGAIRELVAHKARAGQARAVRPLEEAPGQSGGNVVDLAELLRGSLARDGAAHPGRKTSRRGATGRAARKQPGRGDAPTGERRMRA